MSTEKKYNTPSTEELNEQEIKNTTGGFTPRLPDGYNPDSATGNTAEPNLGAGNTLMPENTGNATATQLGMGGTTPIYPTR